MQGWAPSYKRVAVTWSYEHTDGSQQTIEIELTPQNSTEGARECAAHALNGLVSLVNMVRSAQTQKGDA